MAENYGLMGFPVIPFHLCDFWGIHEEVEENGNLWVRGTLPGGTQAIAQFRKQSGPRGSWTAYDLKEA